MPIFSTVRESQHSLGGKRRLPNSVSTFKVILLGFFLCSTCARAECPHKIISPGYPELARQARMQGTVKVDIALAGDGTVASAHGSGAHRMLTEAAERDVRQWVFAPASSPRRVTFTFVYALEGDERNDRIPPRVTFDFPDRVTISTHPSLPQP